MTRAGDAARARRAKGSVQEAIGKIIGDPAVERRGRDETRAGAEQARSEGSSKAVRGDSPSNEVRGDSLSNEDGDD